MASNNLAASLPAQTTRIQSKLFRSRLHRPQAALVATRVQQQAAATKATPLLGGLAAAAAAAGRSRRAASTIAAAAASSGTDSEGEQGRQQVVNFGQGDLPSQGDMIVKGIDPDDVASPLAVLTKDKSRDVDYLAELIAIQQNGPKAIGFFGTRNMGFLHQQLIEILSYAMVLTGNHIYTSGATGTNAAVIRGALRAENPELLTVVLPQSLDRQPAESQELLSQVENVVSMPQNNELPLIEASRICNKDIVNRVQQVICFAFHDSKLMLETCQDAREGGKLVTLFYLD